MKRNINILGTGSYVPLNKVTSLQIDQSKGLEPGSAYKKSGVLERYHSQGENAVEMGAKAAKKALENAKIKAEELDLIICAQAVPFQLIPSNATLLQRYLELGQSKIPCFDVNSTCLSFVTALDQISYAIHAGQYKKVLLVSSEVASVGLSSENQEVFSLFGDGAAAVVIGPTQQGNTSALLASGMETFSDGYEFCQIRGGGTGLYSSHYTKDNHEEFMFQMSGTKVFKLALQQTPPFVRMLLDQANLSWDAIDLLIPHQASGSALALMQRKLELPDSKFFNIISQYGNMVSASIPFALDKAIENKQLKRGQKVILAGTSAGLSLGGVILEY